LLDISGTSVTDAGLLHLRSIRNLQKLFCLFTQLTDACIPAIAGLENLRELHIMDTEISDEGKQELRRRLPALRINPG
jgi:hypothetical protein